MRCRAFLASCGAAFVSLPWTFHWDLLLQTEILGLPERVLLQFRTATRRFGFHGLTLIPRSSVTGGLQPHRLVRAAMPYNRWAPLPQT